MNGWHRGWKGLQKVSFVSELNETFKNSFSNSVVTVNHYCTYVYNGLRYWLCIYIINPHLSVCPFHTHTAETVWPTVMKFCVRNLSSLGMISIEKKFGKIEKKKISKFFPDYFWKIFFSALLTQKWIFRWAPSHRRPSLEAPKAPSGELYKEQGWETF